MLRESGSVSHLIDALSLLPALPLVLALSALWALGSVWVVDRLGNSFYDAGLARLLFKACLVLVLLPLPLLNDLIAAPLSDACARV